MTLWQFAGVILALLLVQAAGWPSSSTASEVSEIQALLQEPGYFIEKAGGKWTVRKPGIRVFDPEGGKPPEVWTVFADTRQNMAEWRKEALPKLRLSRALVRFDPVTRRRTLVEDWARERDARATEADVRALLDRFAPPDVPVLLSSTPLYLARLNGASGHTAEEWNDQHRFVMYIDPFRATGRLHAASTLVHELSHVASYRKRGFHANRAAAVLTRSDFILLGVSDEFAAYEAEAAFIESFVNSVQSVEERGTIARLMMLPELRWPAGLVELLGFGRSPEWGARRREARRHVVLDLDRQAARYWNAYRKRELSVSVEAVIRDWYLHSSEWKEIAGKRAEWLSAGACVGEAAPSGSR
ncbi:MAG: hypothetical protein HUU41_14060 [Bryobacteraceae bacterium]|nr:hypothetical protein [Bryobacterales bacterium]NUN02234.1 hypothetical protein [Bryobacteraceae bacterium]